MHAGGAWRDFPLDLVAKITLRNVELVLGLEVYPKFRRGALVYRELEGRVGGEEPLAERNLVHPVPLLLETFGELADTHAVGLKKLRPEDVTPVHGSHPVGGCNV